MLKQGDNLLAIMMEDTGTLKDGSGEIREISIVMSDNEKKFKKVDGDGNELSSVSHRVQIHL
jgi:hypothetical protein